MKNLCDKYARKLAEQGLAALGDSLVAGLDAELVWNREDPRTEELAKVFDGLSINSLVFSKPAEPYATIIDFLASRYPDVIRPEDTETRTFLHDIPVCHEFSAEAIIANLKKRKSVIIPGEGVVSYGTVSPEQGFVFYSSTAFACFVLFFSEYMIAARAGDIDAEYQAAFEKVVSLLPAPRTDLPVLASAPLNGEDDILAAIAAAGRATVEYGLVDSFFGNISWRENESIYISQTASSLDELEGCIDPCPMDGGSTHGITASSELSAHEGVYRRSDVRCILHGHPKFSVIMSMDCDKADCENRGQCHVKCSEARTVEGVPIVPGEVGTGPTGLSNTLPPALVESGSAIVHGHGLFTSGAADFNDAFKALLETENRCREYYFRCIKELT
ncbi:MAG: class II aldolase/adducin family protein [Pseudodesulfovibrio sp.]